MSQEQLRETIVWAAMPLIGEYDTLTTSRIAEAAGVDEAAVLTIFDDKDAVVQACMDTMRAELAAALDPSEAVRQLDAVPMNRPLATRLVAVIDILDAYYERARVGFDDIEQSTRPRAAVAGKPRAPMSSRENLRVIVNLPETEQAVARLLEPDREGLRLPADVLAKAFLGMSLGAVRTPHPDRIPLPAEQLVDLFLHGARTTSGTDG
jgi:AcrR family transcriptional regulator